MLLTVFHIFTNRRAVPYHECQASMMKLPTNDEFLPNATVIMVVLETILFCFNKLLGTFKIFNAYC
jgi:hypothetical protein